MKKFKFISVMLSVALLGTMLNFTILAEEPNADAAAQTVVYEQNFDNCDWWDGGKTPTEEQLAETIFYPNAQNVDKVSELQAGMYGRADADKSLHLGATFKHGYRMEDDGVHEIAWGAEDGKFWPIVWDGTGRGNNAVSHRMSLNAREMSANESYMHVSFSAAQTPMPQFEIAGDNGAGLDVAFDFFTDRGNVNDKEVLRWCNNNRRQAVFGTYYEVGVPDKAPMTAGRWINYDYVFHTSAKTLDVYLNGYPVIKGKDISGEITVGNDTATITGLSKLNFQVRDIEGDGERNVDVYVDDIKVTYSADEPVISPQSVFGDKAKINAPEKYVNNETGVIYYYGQSLEDMKKYIHADGGDKKVYVVAKKWWNEANSWWTETTDSLNDFRMLQGDIAVNPVLCVEDGTFTYCYEVKQPLSTALNPEISVAQDGITLKWDGNAANCQGIEIFRDDVKIATLDGSEQSYTDTDVAAKAYEYTIRELLPDNNVSVFTDSLSNISRPENFTAVQVLNRLAVQLTWEAPAVGMTTGYEIYRNGVLLTTVAADVFKYTDRSAIKKDTTYRYSAAAIFSEVTSVGTPEVSVFVTMGNSDSRIIFAENFDSRNWWNGETPSNAEFERKPFFAYLDANNGQNMTTDYKLENGTNGRASGDKSLHINATFKLPFGKQDDGETNVPNSAEEGTWMGGWDGDQGTNGVSHRMVSNSQQMEADERYLHVSFSAAQNPMPPESVLGENGAGLDVSFDFINDSGNVVRNKEMLHWYGRRQGVFSTFYEVRTDANKWVNYDYIFDKEAKTVDIYVNGYPSVKGKDISGENLSINGLNKLNFQVRDINTGAEERSIDVYVDDIKVAYSKDEPVISPYFSFGDAAYIAAPEKYIDNEAGVIYNYGQSLSDMKRYISGKKVYLVKEKADSTVRWQSLEEYASDLLNAVNLNDGRTVSPILYVEDGSFTYCYEIKQSMATSINIIISDIAQNSITLSWDRKSDNCRGIEIFRDGVRIAALDGSAQSYTDTNVSVDTVYQYCIREILTDGSATNFSDTRSSFISAVGRPENFAVALIPGQLAVKLTWEAPRYGTATGYEIYRNDALLMTVGADVHEYTDSSALAVGSTYRYSVAAVGEGSAKSDKTSEILIVADVIAPPQNLKAEDANGDVKLSWDGVEGAQGYEVYRNGMRAAQTTDCFIILKDCADDSLYEFFVKTVNAESQASRASETVRYITRGSKFDVFCDVFGDMLGEGLSYTTTNGAVIESGAAYSAIGTSGMRVGFNSMNFAGQSAGFSAAGGLDFSKIKSSAAEIRFLMYVPNGLDISKLSFGVAQDYRSSMAGGTVKLKAVVALDGYVKNTGWNFVRIPLKDLPEKGVYTATSANLPYEVKFDYAHVAELGFFSKLEGISENTYFMVDEIAVYANQAPGVVSVKANGSVLENGAVISGQTNRFSVQFDTEMDGGQLSSTEMKVMRRNKKVPSIVEYDKNSGEYVICLLDSLEVNQAYSLVVENAVSKGGTVQKQKYTVSFTTDSTAGTEPIVKTVDMNLQSMSGTTNAPIVQTLDFAGGAANEAICGFDIEISYDSGKLFLNKDEVKIASNLKNNGITVGNENGKLKIHCAVDKTNNMSLKDGIGTFAIRALESGSSQISAAGTLYCYYSDADAVKEFAVNGGATISATAGLSSSTGSGGSGGSGGGSSSIGGARPVVGGNDPVITPPVKAIFSDISSVEWAREGILYLSEKNIINGYEDNTFRPNNSITREEFVAIIVRAFDMEDESVASDFVDVNQSAWYYKYVSCAVNAGIIKGIDNDTFGAGETISRQDMCTIMSRVIESRNLNVDKKYSKLEFSDGNEIADYAKEAVTELQQMGIVNGIGDNLFAPQGEVTRAMAAKVVYEMIQGRNR